MMKKSRIDQKKYKGVFLVIFSIIILVCSTVAVQSCGFEKISECRNGIIMGVVTDAETDDPIPDVLMILKYHEVVRTELTDSKGQYIFKDVPLCFCLKNISAAKRGYESQYKMVAVYKITYVDFSLVPIGDDDEPEKGVITGIVTDAKTDEPITDAQMTLKYHDVVRIEFTDSEGKYTFKDVPICECLKNVSVSKKGYEGQYKMVAVYKITYVDFSLEPIGDDDEPEKGVITGIVTDAVTSEPIPDALMTLKYHDIVRTELTDSEGRYTFNDVPICFCLKNISASKEGYEGQYKLVPVSKITYVDFSLKPIDNGNDPNEGIITGIVKDAVTDDPIPDVLMTLKYHDIIRTELTDSNGWYTFTNVPICFCLKNISASKRGYESQYELVAVSEITYVNFTLNPTTDDLTDANSNLVSDKIDTGETPIESKSYFIITGLAGIIVVLIMGFYIFNIKKIKLRRKP